MTFHFTWKYSQAKMITMSGYTRYSATKGIHSASLVQHFVVTSFQNEFNSLLFSKLKKKKYAEKIKRCEYFPDALYM